MNKLLLKMYLKTNNEEKIKNLDEKDFRNAFNGLTTIDKIKLAHLKGNTSILKNNLNHLELSNNGIGLYEKLEPKDNLLFYMELIDHINQNELFNNQTMKRFNTPFWKNKLEESGYAYIPENEIYTIINKNEETFIDLIENNNDFRKMFFSNASFEGNKYELKIGKLLTNEKIAGYLAKQKEMKKFYNNTSSPMLYDANESFYKNLPDEFKYVIGYHIKPITTTNNKVKNKYRYSIERKLFTCLSDIIPEKTIYDIMALYETETTNDNIASLISLIIKDNDFYEKFRFILESYFDNDINNGISFCKKYENTKLLEEISDINIPDIKEKIKFLGFANRLKGIDNLDIVINSSLEELKQGENDLSTYKEKKEEIRIYRKEYNEVVSINHDREIIIITQNGEIYEREVTGSHDEAIYNFIKANNYFFDGLMDLKQMIITVTNNSNILIIVEGDNLINILPSKINDIQKETLKTLLTKVNEKSNIELAYQEGNEIYSLNNGLAMNNNKAVDELTRIKTKTR